ncbi:uncharacterized protein LOC132720017 [Ruditapes philippinarum]|uniref:uncharacterized protein LOC132720017 n=1 Tax=Ruditapes philippinarum TaxID=129788 RepID=UPI00295AD6CD|nr:uncharacterized protein LOC132720017 [Ruditapes philippinarum]
MRISRLCTEVPLLLNMYFAIVCHFYILTVLAGGTNDKDGRTETHIEGLDYFYNSATGKNESCSDRCDIPSLYEYTCGQKCKLYVPQQRVTFPPTKSFQEYIQDIQDPIFFFPRDSLGPVIVGCLILNAFGEKSLTTDLLG